jgi:nucleoid-associated protein YgaU
VLPGDSAATIQSKLNSVQAGNSLVFTGGATYDFGGTTIVGKSGVTIWADGPVVIANAPGAGTSGAFDFSGKSDWTIGGKAAGQGFVFNGSLVDATNASGWTIGNSQFNNQQSNGFDGSAIRMNGASFGTIINNDFTGVGGNVIGMYNLTNITIDGNHFTNCYEPISIQEPLTADTSLGNDIIIRRNTFEGTQRAAIEIGPASEGAEYFSGLVIDSNYFDNFNNTAGDGTLLPISLVGQAAQNTTVTNNFIRRGPADAGGVGVAIEMSGSGIVSGNTIVNFSFAVLTYQSGWNVSGNTIYNDGSSPYFGFANNGSGTGTFGSVTVATASPVAPAKPVRVDWGGSIGVVVVPPSVTGSLLSDTGLSALDGITASAALHGTASGGAVVHFKVDGTTIAATATTNANGAWSFTPTGLADGSHTVVASVTNTSGVTASASLAFTLDTKAPVPVVAGALFAGNQVTVTGTSEAASRVAVYDGGTLLGTVTAGSDGKWSLIAAGAATVSHTYSATATDVAGNVGQTAASYQTAPAAPPVVTGALANDTGRSSTDKTTATAALVGTSDANAVVHFTVDGASIAATATANASGAWSFTPSGLADGNHTIVASVTNAAGMTGSTSLAFTLDTKAPAPLITGATFANGQVTLTGTSEAGSIVSIYEGYTLVGTATAGSDGKWTMTGAADGTVAHWFGGGATDAAGNVGNTATTYATVPQAPPALPTVTGALASDTGASASDRITSSATIAGSTDANAVVRFTVDNAAIAATATANASGAWSFTPAGLADGSHTIVASVTNASGATASTTLAFTLDTKAPVPAITGAAFAGGRVTLTGTSEAASTVSVYEGLTLIGTAIAGSDGKWTMTGAGDGAAPHWYGAVATDLAGNVGNTAGDYRPAPAVTIKLLSDTGASAVDQITSSALLTGTADANAVVRFTVDNAAIAATATANASGVWSFTPAGLADGGHTIVASETNASGMTGTALIAFTLDTKAPVPVFAGIVASNGQATLTGSTGGATGEVVSIYDGGSLVGTATTGKNGSFSLTIAADGSVAHVYSGVAKDLAGNIGKGAGMAYLGGSKADSLAGTAAADILQGGANADSLTGGGGADRFVYRSVSDSRPAAADTITDFLHGVDKIDFTNIAGINATSGVPQFQGKLAAAGNVVLKAHGVAFLESGGFTQVLVNTSNADETVSATNSTAADMKIMLVGVNLGLAASDFMHA